MDEKAIIEVLTDIDEQTERIYKKLSRLLLIIEVVIVLSILASCFALFTAGL